MLTRSIIVTMIFLLGAFTGLQAQTNYAFTAPAASGLPGSIVEVGIDMGAPSDSQGFQFGLSHVAPTLTLSSIEQGSDLLMTNNGDGADFFTSQMAPLGGPGLIVGAIVSLAPPLESIPAGTSDVAHVMYTVASDAGPGSTTALAFLNTLGDPPVNCVISVNGVSQQPILNHGSFTVETPAPSGVTVTIDDACNCSGTLNWTNEAAYDSIEITQDGITTSHAGTATSASISLTDGVLTDFDVVGISNGQSSAAGMGTGICTQTPPSVGPSGLTCVIDHLTCTVTLSWFNNDPAYQALTLLVDGVVTANLPGDATTVDVTLAEELIEYTLEITGSGACGETLDSISCLTACLPERFKRGDVNVDGTLDISDAIGTLNYLFQNLPLACFDSVDANDDGSLDISDAVSILNYIFAGGLPPADPGPNVCGVDPTDDALDCAGYNTDLCD